MNITLLANRDLASNLALNQLLPVLAEKHCLRVFLSSRVGAAASVPEELAQLSFFEQTLFNELLFPLLDRTNSCGRLKSFDQLAQYCDGVPTTLNQVNSAEGLATLAQTTPDLVLSIRYGGILKAAVIALPRHGVINLHSGRLPDYRGVMASFRALLNGDRQLGATVHYISDGSIDTGDVIGTTCIDANPDHSYLWHVLQMYPAACRLLADTVDLIDQGEDVPCQPQAKGGNYFSFPSAAELARFRECGYKLYDVNEISQLAQHYLDCQP